MSLPKPVMRGLLAKRLRFHLPIAFGLSLVAAIAFKVRIIETFPVGETVLVEEPRSGLKNGDCGGDEVGKACG